MDRKTERRLAYFVGGVNGVGKTTVLKEITEKHSQFQIIKGSSVFMTWLGIEQGDYESLRALPDDYKRREFDKMMEDLLSEQPMDGKTLLIDAHYFHYKRGEMLDTTGEWISMIDALFVVTGDTDAVLSRVLEDKKERDLFPINSEKETQRLMLAEYLEGTLNLARQLSDRHNVPLYVLDNKQGDMASTINSFLEAHAGIINDND